MSGTATGLLLFAKTEATSNYAKHDNMTTCYHPEKIMVHVCEALLCVWHMELSEERQLLELLSTRSITVSALKA